MAVILSAAKDLQFPSGEHQCRFFAPLRMTVFQGSRGDPILEVNGR